MKKFAPLLLVAWPLMLMLAVGCGDDETTTITEYDTVTITDTVPVPMLVKGYAYLLPVGGLRDGGQRAGFATAGPYGVVYPHFVADIYATEPIEPAVDSVIWGDSACVISIGQYSTYGDPFTSATYSNIADTVRFASGNTVDFTFYAYGKVASGQITLLDYIGDQVVMVDSATPDTVEVDSGFTVVWNEISNAEWYGILVQYRHGGTGMIKNHETLAYTYDTTYTVPSGATEYDGYVRVYVAASTGPVRDAAVGNVTGGAFTGTVYSYANATQSLTYVGTGVPALPPLAKGLPGVNDDIGDDVPVDSKAIIDAIMSQ